MSPGRKVVAVAENEVGVREIPDGSNSGARVREYQASTYLGGTGWPWCAAFVEWCYETAGVDHAGLIDPSTAIVYQRAKAAGAIGGTPIPGAWILWPGTHIGLIAAPTADPNVVHTIEGNSSNSVARRVRSLSGATVVTPPALLADPEPLIETVYFFEDPGAEYEVYGPYARRAYAERAKRAKGGEIRTLVDGRFVVRVGQQRHFGPWVSKAGRDKRMAERAEHVGRRMRPYSRRRQLQPAGPAQAEDLGQTT